MGRRRTAGLIAFAACACALALAGAGCGGDDSGGTTTIIERTVVETAPAPPETTASPEPPPDEPAPDKPPPDSSNEGRGDFIPPEVSEAPGEILELSAFRSPTGNIGCMLIDGTARCDIQERNWEAPRPGDCPADSDYGQGLEVGGSGPGKVVCAGDTALDPNASVLEYGTGASSGDIVCVSRRDGMTCTNGISGHGFMINRERYELF